MNSLELAGWKHMLHAALVHGPCICQMKQITAGCLFVSVVKKCSLAIVRKSCGFLCPHVLAVWGRTHRTEHTYWAIVYKRMPDCTLRPHGDVSGISVPPGDHRHHDPPAHQHDATVQPTGHGGLFYWPDNGPPWAIHRSHMLANTDLATHS